MTHDTTVSTANDLFGELIHSYSRAEAIEDGDLLDVTKEAQETGFRYPVALTSAAFAHAVAMTDAAKRAGNDPRGRLHDVLYMLLYAMKTRTPTRTADGGQELLYNLYVVQKSTRPTRTTLKAHIGPGDNLEPVITIMLPSED